MASTGNPGGENPDASDRLPGAKASPIDGLWGLLRDEMAAYGGGEAFLKWLRTDPKPQDQCEGSMEIRFTLTLEDYTEGNRMLLLHSTLGRKVNYYVFVRFGWFIGIATFCIAAALTVLNFLRPGSSMDAAWAGILAAIGWVGIMCMISPFTYRRKLVRCFREQKLPSERILATSDSGIHIARADGESESRMSWSGFDKGLETEQMFVLFPNRRQFVSVPKRAMTPEQQDKFRDLMTTHVPGTGAQAQKALS